MDYKKYIGIPYSFNQSSYEAADCLGLVKLFYRDKGWKETWDDGQGKIDKDWFINSPYRMLFYLERNFDKTNNIDELQEGDILYFTISGEGHIAIYIGYGKFLSTMPPTNTFFGGHSFIDRIQYLPVKIRAMFKRRGN